MTYTVVISERTAQEIEGATAWWARERSAEQAVRWYQGIRGAIAGLATSPERCPLAAESAAFPFEIRELHYGLGRRPTHRAVFRITDEQVLVLTVRHVAQDQLRPEDL